MNDSIRILGLAGSLRKASYNRALLRAAQQLVPAGAKLDIIELDGIPPFNQDDEASPPASVVQLKARIKEADAVLFVTPEYNYSVPGVLKNAIDWASRPYGQNAWKGKPAAIMGASIGFVGTARAQYHLRQMMVFLDVPVVTQPEVLIGTAAKRFSDNGELTDETSRKLIVQLFEALIDLTRKMARQSSAQPA
jgi:chromate reductase, NAD(P)H dehydrogenase (quinone)